MLGDVMLGRGVAERLASVPPEEVWAPELIEITSSLDLLICNLECPISDRGQPTELGISRLVPRGIASDGTGCATRPGRRN